MRVKSTSSLLVSGLVASLGLSCASPTVPDPRIATLDKAESQCREGLAQAHYLEARAAAEAAINTAGMNDVEDVVLDQVRFCYTTARTLKELDEISSKLNNLITSISDLVESRKAATGAPAFKAQAALIDDVMRALLDPMVKLLETNQEQFDAILLRNRFYWHPARIPVTVADAELMDAAGNYDIGEVRIISGMNRALLANLYMLRGLTYPLNLQAISTYATLANDTPLKHFEQRPILSIMNALVVMLGTHKDFLTLEPEAGVAEMQNAGNSFGAAVGDLLAGIDVMKARKSAQANHVIEYKREDNNDYFIVHIDFAAAPDTRVELKKFNDTTIWLKEDVVASLGRLKESLVGADGARANLQEDIFPIAALVAVVLLSSGAIDAVIADVLKNIDPVLAEKLRLTFDISSLNQDYVLASLLATVPMEMEIDFNHMFQKPTGLRDILPAWYQPITAPVPDDTVMSAFTEATFVLDYECAENPLQGSTKNILCSAPVDGPHFAAAGAYPWQNNTTYNNFGPRWTGSITADGIASTFPYIGFKDPTFGDILYIDLKEGMQPATQKTLNATLAEVMDLLITIY